MKKVISIDFKKINDISSLHDDFKQKLGFPDFYGKNINALIDCLSSMRFPEEGMSELTLKEDETLILELKDFSNSNMIIINNLLIAIEEVNKREANRGRTASILLSLS